MKFLNARWLFTLLLLISTTLLVFSWIKQYKKNQQLTVELEKQAGFLQLLENATLAFQNGNFKLAEQLFSELDSIRITDSLSWENQYNVAYNRQQSEKNMRDSLRLKNRELVDEVIKKIRTLQQLDQQLYSTQYALDSSKYLVNTLIDSQNAHLQQIEQTKKALNLALTTHQKLLFKTEDGKNVRYYGETKNGQAFGFGIGIIESGGIYEGHWQANRRHGQGVYTYANGDVYTGNYANGKRNGQGIYQFVTGEKYDGGWRDELRHGFGRLLDAGGNVLLDGEWEKDRFIRRPNKSKTDSSLTD